MKTKIKCHGEEVTDFYDKKTRIISKNSIIPKALTFLAKNSLDYPLLKDGNYYPKAFLKECNYIEKKVVKHIHDNLSDFSYSSGESDEE